MKSKNVSKLSVKIAIISTIMLVVVFAILICFSVVSTKLALSNEVSNEFEAFSKDTGHQVQAIVNTAYDAASNIKNYLETAYEYSNQGKRNILGQDFENGNSRSKDLADKRYISTVYNVPISEMSLDTEKYILEACRSTVMENENIVGAGVYFEPYAYDTQIKDYAFYISKDNINNKVVPVGEYSWYSQEIYYKRASDAKKAIFTEPYDYEGIKMVSAAIPVIYNGELKGVVAADINVTDFDKVKSVNERYPSMFTTIVDSHGDIIFDTQDIKNIQKNMYDFFNDPSEINNLKDGISSGKEFNIIMTLGGDKMSNFFYPIEAGEEIWWSITALSIDDMNRSVKNVTVLLVVISIMALCLIVIFLSVLLKHSLKPIENIVIAANDISKGNLNININTNSNDEIGLLSEAFSQTANRLKLIIDDVNFMLGEMAEGNFDFKTTTEESYVGDFRNILMSVEKINSNLGMTLSQIRQSAEQVLNGSQQASSGSEILSQGATEQASSIQELAATLNDVSNKVKINADNAKQASQRANSVGEESIESNKRMQDMLLAMEDISKGSNEIGKIIKTIEDIAFQTNILALNAAVEAARAGEAGKGFSVVADEVRSLASKSREASQNTTALIESSLKAVENGIQIANQTAESLSVVVNGIVDITGKIDKISSATNEQSDSINQISQGIEQVSSVVQTNSATAEESAATSEELSSQAQLLKSFVEKFRFKSV